MQPTANQQISWAIGNVSGCIDLLHIHPGASGPAFTISQRNAENALKRRSEANPALVEILEGLLKWLISSM